MIANVKEINNINNNNNKVTFKRRHKANSGSSLFTIYRPLR